MHTMTDLADEWLLTLGTVSEQTRAVYGRSLRQFLARLAAEHVDVTEPEQVARRDLDGWMAHLTEQARVEITPSGPPVASRPD